MIGESVAFSRAIIIIIIGVAGSICCIVMKLFGAVVDSGFGVGAEVGAAGG